MTATNLVVLWAAWTDPIETGVYIFFIPTAIGSFAILGYENVKTGLGLAGLTNVFFLVAYLWPSPITAPMPSEQYLHTSFILNYFISATVSILIVHFLINLNKHSERDLIKKEHLSNQKNIELKSVNEALDRFVYSVSHDLRSPLSSIIGLTNIARVTNESKELDQLLVMILDRVNAQDNYIQEIIDYSRNARTDVAVESVPLHHLITEVIDTLKFNINADKIEFRNLVDAETVLISDRIRLKIIISNLVSNAIKYHAIHKENPFIEIGYQISNQLLYVKDNGIGISPEYQDKIFNMFFRGSERSKGSGLGLFITKESVNKLDGTIEVKSAYGEGSTFMVRLNTLK